LDSSRWETWFNRCCQFLISSIVTW
jgi:hypothetical protein